MIKNLVIDFPLPALREDIQLLEGPTALDGSPTWTIFDPVRNSYFKIGWAAFQLLSRWSSGKAQALLGKVRSETTCIVNEKDIQGLIRFLYSNSLTRDSVSGNSNDYYAQYLASKPNWFIWLLKNYLFLRIPLFHPDKFLQSILPYVAPFFSITFRNIVLFLGVIGLYLVARQWDTFINTFLYFFNIKGAILYFVALSAIKVFHELGHALTATRYGCKIPAMGITFLVLFPVLYTDTTDAWRLTSRRQRLYIGAAGMITELYVALICTFLWSFMPDGILRSTAFVVATVSWLLTLAINLNPFMRFDGYYMLSDWLGVQNLQFRSFALGKWKLRQVLFAIDEGPPERLPGSTHKVLIIYAWATWIYRFVLLVAIALVVYYFFFKLLGIILLVAELYFFIILPVMKEIFNWWNMRNTIIKSGRFYITCCMCLSLLPLFFIPWSSRVSIPAILEPTDKATVYTPAPGRIESVKASTGDVVKEGDVIMVVKSPRIEDEILRTQKKIEAIHLRSQRRAANIDDLADLHIVLQQLKGQESKLEGLLELQDRLVIHSPISGRVVDMADSLHPGRWINEKLALVVITSPDTIMIEGMVYENDLARVNKSQPALFIPDNPERKSIHAMVNELEYTNITRLDIPYLASQYGGEIAVRKSKDNHLIPKTSVYKVKFIISDGQITPPEQVIRGIVHVKGEQRSFAERVFELVAAVFVRESGF